MKRFLVYLFIVLGLVVNTKADDIRDFQVGGVSIGDSLLDHFDKIKITNALKDAYYYPDRKFLDIFIKPSNASSYEILQITLKNTDKSFTTHSVGGQINFINKIDECYKKQKEIVKEIQLFFDNKIKPTTSKLTHPIDKSGKSKVLTSDFQLKGGRIEVQCFDWSNKLDYTDKLVVIAKSSKAIEYFFKVYQ
jgi:hypothetical protein